MEQSAPEGPAFTVAARRIDASLKRLERLAADQYGARLMLPSDGMIVQRLAAALRANRMLSVSRIGKVILKFAPGAERALKVPGQHSSPKSICDAADRMVKLVRPHARLFTERGLPKDFATGLRDAAKELRTLLRNTDTAQRTHARVTAALAVEIRGARAEVQILDALLRPHTSTDRVMHHLWQIAKRVGPRKGRPKLRRKTNANPGPAGG
jgi:hypothetical protein